MQGKKNYQEKLFLSFQLSDRVSENNFYRRLRDCLDLNFLYAATKPYYGDSGQKSIDPVVFFKLCLVGYLENIISDRKLIEHCSMRLDILFFIGYDIDEELPWHSTISRTRQLFPETIFLQVFDSILQMCIDKGMVSGHTQAIDSAPVKANASMDSLELKVPADKLEDHLQKIRHISAADKHQPIRKAQNNKATPEQQTITANANELKSIVSRNKKWAKDQNHRPGAAVKTSKYTSNKTHYSPTDPDARISVKPGKARKLNYLSQLTVDISKHVITDIKAYHADGKDNQQLQDITKRVHQRLWKHGLVWQNCVADTGYSSGENYAFLEAMNLTSFIPAHGTYKGNPENFKYIREGDYYLCPQGERVTFRKQKFEKNSLKRHYLTRTSQCKECPIKKSCLGKSKEKRIAITAYRDQYERNIARVKSKQGRYMKAKRQSTVEPVFGTLTQFMGLRKINTIGIQQANKVMHLSATAYNLKKYLKFTRKASNSGVQITHLLHLLKKATYQLINFEIKTLNFSLQLH